MNTFNFWLIMLFVVALTLFSLFAWLERNVETDIRDGPFLIQDDECGEFKIDCKINCDSERVYNLFYTLCGDNEDGIHRFKYELHCDGEIPYLFILTQHQKIVTVYSSNAEEDLQEMETECNLIKSYVESEEFQDFILSKIKDFI